jgi:hypothetical protein
MTIMQRTVFFQKKEQIKKEILFLFVLFFEKKYNNNGCYNFTDYSSEEKI